MVLNGRLWAVEAARKEIYVNARVKARVTLAFNRLNHCVIYSSHLFQCQDTTNATSPSVRPARSDSALWHYEATAQIPRAADRVRPRRSSLLPSVSVSVLDELPVRTALKTVVFGESFSVALIKRLVVK
jgi:hypothetical protein